MMVLGRVMLQCYKLSGLYNALRSLWQSLLPRASRNCFLSPSVFSATEGKRGGGIRHLGRRKTALPTCCMPCRDTVVQRNKNSHRFWTWYVYRDHLIGLVLGVLSTPLSTSKQQARIIIHSPIPATSRASFFSLATTQVQPCE